MVDPLLLAMVLFHLSVPPPSVVHHVLLAVSWPPNSSEGSTETAMSANGLSRSRSASASVIADHGTLTQTLPLLSAARRIFCICGALAWRARVGRRRGARSLGRAACVNTLEHAWTRGTKGGRPRPAGGECRRSSGCAAQRWWMRSSSGQRPRNDSIHRRGQNHNYISAGMRNKPAARGGPRSLLHLSVSFQQACP